MDTSSRVSLAAVLALIAGIFAVVFGIMALASNSDWYLAGIALSLLISFVSGIYGCVTISGSEGRLQGKGVALLGMGLPVGGFVLGFLLLPQT
jgi:hypothetical protein